jgi:lipoprotein-anchoring transpeptidase ErfK/SrfK
MDALEPMGGRGLFYFVKTNLFIHGIPYYPGGKPVTSKYSGGCVRVPTDNQAQLYEKIAIGTPVVIY